MYPSIEIVTIGVFWAQLPDASVILGDLRGKVGLRFRASSFSGLGSKVWGLGSSFGSELCLMVYIIAVWG